MRNQRKLEQITKIKKIRVLEKFVGARLLHVANANEAEQDAIKQRSEDELRDVQTEWVDYMARDTFTTEMHSYYAGCLLDAEDYVIAASHAHIVSLKDQEEKLQEQKYQDVKLRLISKVEKKMQRKMYRLDEEKALVIVEEGVALRRGFK